MTLEEAVTEFEKGHFVRRNAYAGDVAPNRLYRIMSGGWQTHAEFSRTINDDGADEDAVAFLTEAAAVKAWLKNAQECASGKSLFINWCYHPKITMYSGISLKNYGDTVATGKFYSVYSLLYFSPK